jgi:hypothetical protein
MGRHQRQSSRSRHRPSLPADQGGASSAAGNDTRSKVGGWHGFPILPGSPGYGRAGRRFQGNGGRRLVPQWPVHAE